MSLYKRNNTWWISIVHQGLRIQRTTETSDKKAARQIHDQIKADLWRKEHLHEKPLFTWVDAVMRWLDESQHKRSIQKDEMHLRLV